MIKLAVILGFFFISTSQVYSQKIFEVDAKYKADISVHVTQYKYKADLLVYKQNSELSIEDNAGVWFFVDEAYKAFKKVYFVSSEYQSDLVICYVEHKYQAGWKNDEKKYLLETKL